MRSPAVPVNGSFPFSGVGHVIKLPLTYCAYGKQGAYCLRNGPKETPDLLRAFLWNNKPVSSSSTPQGSSLHHQGGFMGRASMEPSWQCLIQD
ncbi:hypothetical protein GCM10007868_24420 [Gluconobacter frateurii]|uniref:Uncharacterized protein n=1 Tax=Gluconobacter frateurii NRIC 0228 TaxID=1307946 RepID=A0ABQ0Q775_9PROT|nr:hypothetical protein AA0228_0067 [Gluconobacter frateurii NRIC 0228]GLP91367.1 hypothetical protein GCM10007868_24420 [Gluconobacter frateurii]